MVISLMVQEKNKYKNCDLRYSLSTLSETAWPVNKSNPLLGLIFHSSILYLFNNYKIKQPQSWSKRGCLQSDKITDNEEKRFRNVPTFNSETVFLNTNKSLVSGSKEVNMALLYASLMGAVHYRKCNKMDRILHKIIAGQNWSALYVIFNMILRNVSFYDL